MPTASFLHASVVALTALGAVTAQAQAPDRGLASPFGWPRSPVLEASQTRAAWDPSFNWGPVRVMPSLQVAPGGFWGGGVTVATESNWFAGLRLGRAALRRDPSAAAAVTASEAVMLSGGYRWGAQQSISLQVVRDRRDSLGLAVSYDWPSYYLRVGWDNKTRLVPQDIRLSAGVRF